MATPTTSDVRVFAGVWPLAAVAVEAWLRGRTAPRDAVAAMRELRGLPQAERAAVAHTAGAVVAALRRLWFALGQEHAPGNLSVAAQAQSLVLAHGVEAGLLGAEEAARLAATGPASHLDFGGFATLARRLDAVAEPVRRLALRHSTPDWLAERFLAEFGAEASGLLAALSAPPPRTIRANPLRGSREALAAELAAQGVTTRVAAFAPAALHVDGDVDLFATAAYARGAFEQQDEASQLAALATMPPPGGRVLDLCAGSGGKTLAIAGALQGRGEVLATDVHAGRLQALRQRAARAGASNVRALALAADGGWPPAVAEFAARADRILVDAPCSGVGSWRRRPEARWLLQPAELETLAATQEQLLDRAAAQLRPGARLVHATCSLFASENEGRVAALLARTPGLELVRLAEILGGAVARPIADATGTYLSLRPDRHGCDGFFAAVLRRRRTG